MSRRLRRTGRTSLRRGGLATAGLVLALGALAGCGGEGEGDGDAAADAPTDASTEEFCGQYLELVDLASFGESDETSDAVAAAKGWAADMGEVGTPSDIPEEAREGFEVMVRTFRAIDDDASVSDLETFGEEMTAAEEEAADAFATWASQTCPLPSPGA